MSFYSIRRLTVNDLASIVSVNNDCFSEGEAYDAYTITYIYYDNEYHYVAVNEKEEIVGYLMSMNLDYNDLPNCPQELMDAIDKNILTVCSLAVRDHMRGKGIGSSLLKNLIEDVKKDNDITQLVLQVRVSNDRAINLYKKNGFTNHQEILKNYYNDPIEDGNLMFLPIVKKID